MSEFIAFPKIARLSRECVITEKIDGTNGQIFIDDDGKQIEVGSRSRWITKETDNFGFHKWCMENYDELMTLGPGRHFGEWWGSGIQRGYGLKEKRFSLFNVSRWEIDRPSCCSVVPVLYRGMFQTGQVELALEGLRVNGSVAAPEFMKPEGVVIWHTQGHFGLKKTIEKDEEHKNENKR